MIESESDSTLRMRPWPSQRGQTIWLDSPRTGAGAGATSRAGRSGDAADLDAGAVVLQRVLAAVLDLALVLVRLHVDEVDHHQPAEVAQAQLARHFLGRFEVGVERGFLDVAALGGARRVDVDGGQRFGLVDHQGEPPDGRRTVRS
jgi:hypothetical protein